MWLNSLDEDSKNSDNREPGEPSDFKETSELNPHTELFELAQQIGREVIQSKKASALWSGAVQAYKFQQERPMVLVKAFDLSPAIAVELGVECPD